MTVAALPLLQQQATAAYRAGRLKDALQICRQLLKLQRDRPDLLAFAGMIALELGEVAEAAELYRKAVQRRPDYAEAWYNLGNALMRLERVDDAAKAYRRAAELKPDMIPAHNNLGGALHALGRFEAAADAYRRVLRLVPDAPEAERNLGIALEKAGRRAEAIDIYRSVIAKRPDWSVAHSNLANALLAAGDARGTVEACTRWLEVAPGNMEAMALEGLACYGAGDREAARHLLDFDFVRTFMIDVPPGYASLEEFNAALVDYVMTHPTLHVPPAEDPHYHHPALAITATFFGPREGPVADFERVVRAAVADYLRRIPPGSNHPYLMKPPKKWEFASWAAVLHFQGNLTPHIHMDGYVSGVYYPLLPDLVGKPESGQEGFFELGRPPDDFPLARPTELLPIKPEPGRMILFPSYFYHRTIPFVSDQRRISIAFDVMPRD
ncbi:MAG TPA: tetratricopeptide repeat protein [Stellaceae bacterium]|nr:tetratricopeptide repeat protein [Stellaceae bacterium]